MKIEKVIRVTDYHSLGHPLRIITGGVTKIQGKTMTEKKEFFMKNLDHIRTSLLREPRGYKAMAGALITEPISEQASFGVVWMGSDGYFDMCGHGSLCVGKWAVENGVVERNDPVTGFCFDTPAGLVEVKVKVDDVDVGPVSFINVPSFHFKSSSVNVKDIGPVPLEISYGGNFFAFAHAKDLRIHVSTKNIPELVNIASKIRKAANAQIKVEHPKAPKIDDINGVKILASSSKPNHYLGIMIFLNGSIDRTPCGTGTCAHMATLFSKGCLKVDEETIHENLIGLKWKGKIIKETTVDSLRAVVPELTGEAYIIGINTYVLDANDPVKHGFLLN
ncbi:MAG: proline racemase family protein [Candidatus Hodarchaeota archaeon]